MWRGQRAGLSLALCLTTLGLLVGGCGGGSSSSSATSASSSSSGSEPSAQFLKSKGDGKYAKFGSEASGSELEAANVVVVKNLKAREDGDFATQCETLSLKIITGIQGVKVRSDCATALKKLAEPLSGTKELRKDTLDGSIAAMRVKGNQAYALYHGNDGRNWAVPLEKEDGTWKVDALIMTRL